MKNLSLPFATEIVQDGEWTLSSHFNVSGVPAAAVIKNSVVIWRGHPGRLSGDWMTSGLSA
jgi:hypothetical protein